MRARDFTVIECEQRSPTWFQARAGRLTGSVASSLTAKLKSGGEPAARRDLRTKLALERIIGRSLEDDYQNADMKRGIEREPDALAAFEAATGELVSRSGFLAHTSLLMGCSLDAHLGDFAEIVEVKCPRPANHLSYLQGGRLPEEHRIQIVHDLLITGAQAAHFVSWCPEFPEPLRLFHVAAKADSTELSAYELIARQFLREVEREQEAILALANERIPA